MSLNNRTSKEAANPVLNQIRRHISGFKEGTLMFIILIIGAFLSIISPSFLTASNIQATVIGFSIDAIVAIGMALVIISGGIDLSVSGIMALSTVICAVIYQQGAPLVVAIIVSLLVSAICGWINAYFIATQNMPPFIVTLASYGIFRGMCFVITQGTSIPLVDKLPSWFSALGIGAVWGLPVIGLIFLLLTVVAHLMFKKSRIIRTVFYTGSNQKAAYYSGINVLKIKFGVYIVCALICGIAGILTLSRFSFASPVVGQGLEMSVIAACVIGGASLEGGEGSALGAVLGIILLALITNGLVILHISVYWQQFISGIILITAVWFDRYRSKINRKLLC